MIHRPDTTGTPLLAENEKVSPDVEFTPEELLKVIEYQAKKHNRPRLHEAAWWIVQAIEKEVALDIPHCWICLKDEAVAVCTSIYFELCCLIYGEMFFQPTQLSGLC